MKDALGFVEVHIEQGPVLEAENLSVAAVTGIVGQRGSRLSLRGKRTMRAPLRCTSAVMLLRAPPSGSPPWKNWPKELRAL